MKKFSKALLSLLLAILMLLSAVPVSFAANTEAALYGMYGDGMLFRQNSEAVFAGTAQKNSVIRCELKDADGNVIAQGMAKTSDDGTFAVSVNAPEGSYHEYSAVLCENGAEFRTIHHIVFGELWLAGGQSNMLLPLAQSTKGTEMKANGDKGSRWLRFLSTPVYPEYNGKSENVPLNPQSDLKGCQWLYGDEETVYGFSAVAYFFAQKLQKSLNMPVGVIDTSVGGSAIASWLSRSAIDGDPDVKDICIKHGTYIPADKWNESSQNVHVDMTAVYNKKIAPLKNFRLSGLLWYQGEADIMLGSSGGEYVKQLALLQRLYSDLFRYDGTLPLVFTGLPSYGYADDFRLQRFNIELSQFQNADTDSRALMSIYDVDLTYDAAVGSIHPLVKDAVGERLAFCAEGLVYGKNRCYTTATVESVELRGSALYIQLRNTGDGLLCDEDTLMGFSVCDENGIYLPADAEIVSDNVVKVSSNRIDKPVSVAYAVSQSNGRSNLFADVDGYRMPVSPFITDMKYTENLWKDNGWTDCENSRIWRTDTNALAGFADTWSAENAVCSITKDSAYSGNGGLSVNASGEQFSVSPVLKDTDGKILLDIDNDLSKYSTLSFKIRNNSSSELNFRYLKITNGSEWFAPAVSGDSTCSQVLPANGQWHTVTLDLTTLYRNADGKTKADTAKLQGIDGLGLCFEADQADLSIDEFEFTAPEPQKEKKLSFSEKIRAFFQKIIEFFKNLFRVK